MTTVRKATARDLPQMAEMGAALAKMHHDLDAQRFMFGEGFVEGYLWWFTKELPRRKVCFRVVGDDVLDGYVYGRLEDRQWNELLDEHAALVDIWVQPHARKRGVGEALVRAFCAWADEKGAPRVVLSTASQNQAAQQLFARAGFRSTMIEMTRERAAR